MTRITVCGALGRMGSMVVKAVAKEKDMELVAGVETPDNSDVGRDLGEILGLGRLGAELIHDLSAVLHSCDCVVEFTNPEATVAHLTVTGRTAKPYVVGTTGFREEHLAELKAYAENAPLLLSPNMSIGVNLLFKLAPEIARTLGESYDIEIVEAHHRGKADAPSGTARRLAELTAAALGRELKRAGVYGRKGLTGERSGEEIGIHSVRGGDIAGDHTVIYAGPGERLELIHRAHSRETFAQGTVRAIRFVAKAKPGLYDMMDVLDLD